MIDEKKLIEFINNQINWMNNEAKTKSDENVMAGLKVALALIDEQEKVGEWIPCSERFPEEPYGCLVTVMDTNPVTMEDFENLLPYFVGFDGERWNDGDGAEIPFEVIAWMPLPEPYKEESDG